MDETPRRNGELLICPRCSRPFDPGDRYCRKCGAPLNTLPATRDSYAPTVWRSPLPTLTRGVAVVVAGTLAEFVIRRAIRMVFRPRSLLPILRSNQEPAVHDNGDVADADAVIESETFAVRRVRVRRGRD